MEDPMDAPLLDPSSPRQTFFSSRSRPTKYGAISSSTSTSIAITLDNSSNLVSRTTQFVTHRVAPTDTLYSIAVQYGVPPNQILRANRLSSAAGLTFRTEIRVPVSDASNTCSSSALLSHSVSVPSGLQPDAHGVQNGERSSQRQAERISVRPDADALCDSNGVHPASNTSSSTNTSSLTPTGAAGPTSSRSATSGGRSPTPSDIFERVDSTLARTRARLDQPDASTNTSTSINNAHRQVAASSGASETVAFASRASAMKQDDKQLLAL